MTITTGARQSCMESVCQTGPPRSVNVYRDSQVTTVIKVGGPFVNGQNSYTISVCVSSIKIL